MSKSRFSVLYSILKGLIVAIIVTLAGMLLIAALAVFAHISDRLLMVLNQVLKGAAILLGTYAAVGRGGTKGFVTGVVIALLYTILGYALYLTLGGGAFSVANMFGEILIGVAIGAIFGAILVNMSPKSRRRARA